MNVVILMGRLTKDPELRYAPSGLCVCNYSIAVDRRSKEDKQTDFFNCTAFGKAGEFVGQHFKKGEKILVHGRLQNDSYEKDGRKTTFQKIITDQHDFCESRKDWGTPEAKPEAKQGSIEDFMDIPTPEEWMDFK